MSHYNDVESQPGSTKSPTGSTFENARFSWSGIGYTVKQKRKEKTLLDHVDGSVRAGEMMAVSGPCPPHDQSRR